MEGEEHRTFDIDRAQSIRGQLSLQAQDSKQLSWAHVSQSARRRSRDWWERL